MPLTEKGRHIKKAMQEQYGAKRGEEVFYASRNKGTITGVDAYLDSVARGDSDGIARHGSALTERHGK